MDDENDILLGSDEVNSSFEDAVDDDSILFEHEKRNKRKRLLMVSGVVLAGVVMIASIVYLNPFSFLSFGGDADGGAKVSTSEKSRFEDLRVDKDEDFARKNPIPFDHEDWQELAWTEQKDDEKSLEKVNKGVVRLAETHSLSVSSDTLPSEEAGFTPDLDKELLEDGTQNPMFSYWTREIFERELSTYVERLLNPRFGGWEPYQFPEYKANSEFSTDFVSDMFVSGWVEANAGKPYSEFVPVFADWNSDNYGNNEQLIGVSRWFGQVVSSDTDFVYNENTLQYSATFNAKVKFTAWASDQTKLEKTGTLTLHLVPAVTQEFGNGTENRVLIESGSLKVDE